MPDSPFPALAIDYGDARVGIAMTDPLGILAYPLETIHLKDTDPIARITQLARAHGVQTLVLGLPLRLDGSEGTAATKIRDFAAKLSLAIPDTPLRLVDERLTTSAATEKLRAAGKKTKTHRPIIDQAAAVEILNSWLEEQNLLNGPSL